MKAYRSLMLLAGLLLMTGLLLLLPQPGTAQTGACPDFALRALETISELCGSLNRDEACYGNSLVEALFNEAVEVEFSLPADRAPLAELVSIRTSPLDAAIEQWGVAVMNVQANLPDTLPGQAVRFVMYGDVSLQNAGRAEAAPTCAATTTAAVNVRSGPGTNYNVVSSVAAGAAVQLEGRSDDGAWVFVRLDGRPGWISADLVQADCDIMAGLEARSADDTVQYGPMQAFYFSTGFGDPACNEAPPSSLVIQGPQGYEVTLNANGVDVAMGSTIALTINQQGRMGIATLQGQARASYDGHTRVIPAGFTVAVEVDVTLDDEGNLVVEVTGDLSDPAFLDAVIWEALEALPDDFFETEIDLPDMAEYSDLAAFCDDPANAAICVDDEFQASFEAEDFDRDTFLGAFDEIDCADADFADLCDEAFDTPGEDTLEPGDSSGEEDSGDGDITDESDADSGDSGTGDTGGDSDSGDTGGGDSSGEGDTDTGDSGDGGA